jgi:hypothetical protein
MLACALPCVSWISTGVDPPIDWFSETFTLITILRPKVKALTVLSPNQLLIDVPLVLYRNVLKGLNLK